MLLLLLLLGGACEALTRSRQGKITIKSGKMAERHSMLLCRPGVAVTVASLIDKQLIHCRPALRPALRLAGRGCAAGSLDRGI